MTLTQIKPAGLSTPVDLADNAKIRLGTGNDLEIYHNSTSNNSHIDESGSGSLVIKATNTYINSSADESMIAAIADGSVKLYYDNSLKLDVKTWGVEINGDLGLDDNRKLALGNGPDLEIYHDGTYNTFAGANFLVRNAAANETLIYAVENGASELWYDNSKKLHTDSFGVIVSGGLALDGDNLELRIGNSQDLKLYHDGSTNRINASNGNLSIQAVTQHNIILSHAGENMLVAKPDGGVDLYYDNSKKLETFSAGVLVGATSQNGHGTTIGQDGVQLTVNFSTTDIRWMQIWESDHGTDEAKAGVQSDGKIMARTTSIQSFSSERRTKKNIVELDKNKAWNTIRDTPFYTFNYKPEPDGSELHHAPIVDELPADMVVPTQASDEVGVINTYNAERLLFRSFSALQQALKKIETLEAEVAALKAA